MFLKEIEINGILGCRAVHLCFNDAGRRQPVYVVLCEPKCHIRQALSTAIQLICSAKYANIQSVARLQGIAQSCIRLVFLVPKAPSDTSCALKDVLDGDTDSGSDDDNAPTTSLKAQRRLLKRASGVKNKYKFRKISACRDFLSAAETVSYSIDDGPIRTCTPSAFHSKFFTNVDYVFSRLKELGRKPQFNGSWLDLLSSKLCEEISRKKTINQMFDDFTQLFLRKNVNRTNLLSKLTASCLTLNTASSKVKKSYVCKVFSDVRSIFEFVTCSEYTVWFLMPSHDKNIDIKDISADCIDFDNIQTCIQLKSKDFKREYIWTDAEYVIQDLLLLSFQLALAFHCKQKFVYLQKLDNLKDYQALQMITAACLQTHGQLAINWSCKNYLQRIIDVCGKIGVAAVIEYPGGFPVKLHNAYIIQCFKMPDLPGAWGMRQQEKQRDETLTEFVNYIEQGLTTQR